MPFNTHPFANVYSPDPFILSDVQFPEYLSPFQSQNKHFSNVINVAEKYLKEMRESTPKTNFDYQKAYNNLKPIDVQEVDMEGAEVAYDPKTVDLYIKYKKQEFLIEVKSITPSNFIARLRTAIGQVSQYDYIMHKDTGIRGRLGLAFTANIPRNDWSIPFITSYMDMDLLCMSSNNLSIRSNSQLSLELYG